MAVQQMLLGGGLSLQYIIDYICANWSMFYKGDMVSPTVQHYDNGNVSSVNGGSWIQLPASYDLSAIPISLPSTTVIYQELKLDPDGEPNDGGFANTYPGSGYRINSYTITNPSMVYTEAFPSNSDGDSNVISYEDPLNPGTYLYLYVTGAQGRSLATKSYSLPTKDVVSSSFFINPYRNAYTSPSQLVLPGVWEQVSDSGAIAFPEAGGNAYVMDTTSTSNVSVLQGDLVIGITGLAKHPVDAMDPDHVQLFYSWARNADNADPGSCAHGMSLWFSKVAETISISRAIDQYPAARFVVFRYRDGSQGGALPVETPVAPPIESGGGGGGGTGGTPGDYLTNPY